MPRGRPKKYVTKIEQAEKDRAIDADFVGGPRDGDKMRIAYPPMPYCRLAFPEWCTYEWSETEQAYLYIGTEPVPQEVYREWAHY